MIFVVCGRGMPDRWSPTRIRPMGASLHSPRAAALALFAFLTACSGGGAPPPGGGFVPPPPDVSVVTVAPQRVARFLIQIGITQLGFQIGALGRETLHGAYPLQFPLYHRQLCHNNLSP